MSDDIGRDVLVIGGGPTGLALAVALRQYGLDVAVVDRKPSTQREVRASVIWQRALEILRDFGCGERFVEHGLPLRGAEMYVRGRRIGGHDNTMPHTPFPRPLGIEQIAMESLLAERLGELGTDVTWETEAVAVRPGSGGAEVDVRGPDGRLRTIACRWVVGCEGAHSLVRKTLDIAFEGERRADLQALQINALPEWKYPVTPDVTYFFLERRVCLIASPRPGGGYRFFSFCQDPDPARVEPPSAEEMRELVARAAHDADTRLTPTEPQWLNRARFHDRVAASLREGPVMLAGDSAHMWAPVGGRGLNTGFRGAHNLAWKLASVHHGWAVDALLDTYSTEQRRTAHEIMRQMRRNLLELPPAPLTLTAMRLVGPVLLGSERFNRRGRALLSELLRHHRASELSTDRAGRGPLRAGDRLPDLPVTDCGGRRRGLHGLLSYDRWTLLVVPGRAAGNDREVGRLSRLVGRYSFPAEVSVLRAGQREGRSLPGGVMVLVRPDGHIGLRARVTDHRALEEYLGKWFVPKA
ncbi:FAD-dependent oxidoreductase [Streptomyces sp. NPDC053048]|uniref:FAD-dependent oxidoreductase n=1 Tax=Streptomyces sp. NPDC053048 TaxID=3365694 RepID=UPI0037CF90DE